MKAKIVLTFIVFILLFSSVIIKAFYVQVINRSNLLAYSESQFIRKVTRYPKRGQILDRNKNPLAINVKTYGIFAIPKNIKNTRSTLLKLSKIIPSLSFQEMYKKIKNRSKYTWISRKEKLEPAQLEQIEKLEGIYLEEQASRLYPNNELASQILGFVGVDNAGLSGIEYFFDKKLKGEAQIIKYLKDAKGRPIKLESKDSHQSSEDIVLSIDKDIQAALEKHLREGVESSKALSGGAAVMDVETGEIWAMANYPSYDPNNIGDSKPHQRKLSFVSDPFEPGSVFKTFTIAAALENKIVRPDTNYYCEKGQLQVNNHIISEADTAKVYDWLSVSDILAHSSNIGTTKIAFDLTFQKLKLFLAELNFGQKTGIELPGESRGILTSDPEVSALTLSNISFGQGIATTAIQILSGYSAIINGGIYVNPTLIKNSKPVKTKILSRDAADKVVKMLIQAVEDGTGQNAKIPHFVIAGKTSTAQRVSEEGGYKGYVPGFVGFPINVKRKFVVYVYVDNPEGKYYGAQIAAPIFKKITEYILYKNKEFHQMAKLDANQENKTIDRVKTGASSVSKAAIGIIPSFIGLDKRSARQLAEKHKLDIKSKGFGIVSQQYPESGTMVNQKTISLYFTPPKYE